jgi:predicted metal-dependent peptidase
MKHRHKKALLEQNTGLGDKSRMYPEIRDVMDFCLPYCTIGSRLRHKNDDETDHIAYTDDHSVYAGKKYETELVTRQERAFVLLHEWSHCMLAHIPRARKMRALHGSEFDNNVWNIATDAIINAALLTTPELRPQYQPDRHIEMPKIGVRLDKILEKIGMWNAYDTLEDAVTRYSAEKLYYLLLEHRDKFMSQNGATVLIRGNIAGEPTKEWVPLPCEQHLDGHGDDGADADSYGIAGLDDDSKIQLRGMQLAQMRGTMPGLTKQLVSDIPETTTPWQRILRRRFQKHAGNIHTTSDMARGSRRWTALEYPMWQRESVHMVFEPNRRKARAPRIVVVVDSSGSISQNELRLFTAEIATMMVKTKAHIILIVCDAAVHQVVEFKTARDAEKLRNFEYCGRGGTSFVPAFEEADKHNPDAVFYFTDLEGDKIEPRPYDVTWCVPESRAEGKKPTTGFLLVIKPLRSHPKKQKVTA